MRQTIGVTDAFAADSGSLKPLLPGVAVTEGCEQLFVGAPDRA